MTTETIQGFVEEFRLVVSRLRRNFGWYERMVTDSGYDRDSDPRRLPYVDDQTLETHYYGADQPQLGEAQVYTTSGTMTGKRKRILYSEEDHNHYVRQRAETFSKFITPDCRVACSDLGTGHAAASAREVFESLKLDYHHIDYRRPIDEHIDLLNRYRPDVFYTMPMVLDSLITSGNLEFRPRKVIVVGDIATKGWKEYVTDFFSIPRSNLMDLYGSIEVGSIAHECADCALYHFESHIIPETIDPREIERDGAGQPPTEILVLTSTTRTMFPVARFITYDLVDGFGLTECKGRKYFSFERISGRIGSELKWGEKISLYDICDAVHKYLPLSSFEVHKDSTSLTINIGSPELTEDKAESIKLYLLGLNPAVDQMIESRLISDIRVLRVPREEIKLGSFKKSFLSGDKVIPCAQ